MKTQNKNTQIAGKADRQINSQNKSMAPLTIGRLAKSIGINVETIRYYQRIGLIKTPIAPASGFRTYSSETADNIKFIKRAQGLGFNLREIADLLKISDGQCNDVRQRAEIKRDKIEQQIHDLKALRDTLNKLICECASGNDNKLCPIVETLTEHNTL